MEAKPICVIYFPDAFYGDGIKRNWIYEYMRFLNGDSDGNDKIKYHSRQDYYKDYYWFCFYGHDIYEPRIEVFNVKDLSEVNFEELKAMVMEAIGNK